jgi:hypothetical protein
MPAVRVEAATGHERDHSARRCVMRRCRIRVTTALAAVAAVAASGARPIGAAEVFIPDLVLKKTYVKTATEDDGLFLFHNQPFKSIFTPTPITCPGPSGTCTARVEVSTHFFTNRNADGGDGEKLVKCRVLRSGAGLVPMLALPNLVTVASLGDLHYDEVATFSWVFRNLPVGAYGIYVQCLATFGDADVVVEARTLTIDVYKP